MADDEQRSFRFTDHEIVPGYFTEADHMWLRALVEVYLAYEGRKRGELVERLGDPLPMVAPIERVRVARQVLDRLWTFETSAAVTPRDARAALFVEAAGRSDRDAAVAVAALRLGVEPDALLRSLLADLPSERRVTAPKVVPSLVEVAQRGNLALVARLLRRALAVSVKGGSQVRRVVRQAKLKGLLCTVRRPLHPGAREQLEISGPYVLFRQTTLYGRALASLVPLAMQCDDLELRAACVVADTAGTGGGAETKTLILRAGDPIFPSEHAPGHDSKLEARFAREFTRAAPAWDVVREPVAVEAGSTLIFPDFELRHRWRPERRWLLELVGFWTPAYIADKLRRLREAKLERLILCIDSDRNCSDLELPPNAQVIRFRRRLDPRAVLAAIEPSELDPR